MLGPPTILQFLCHSCDVMEYNQWRRKTDPCISEKQPFTIYHIELWQKNCELIIYGLEPLLKWLWCSLLVWFKTGQTPS